MDYLIIGNDSSIRSVNWDAVHESKLTTVGVNRSHIVYPSSDILFLQDPIIIQELLDLGYTDDDITQLNIHTTNYFNTRLPQIKNSLFYNRLMHEDGRSGTVRTYLKEVGHKFIWVG